MEIFKPINEKKAKGKVKKIFSEIKKTRKISKIQNFWRSIEHNHVQDHILLQLKRRAQQIK